MQLATWGLGQLACRLLLALAPVLCARATVRRWPLAPASWPMVAAPPAAAAAPDADAPLPRCRRRPARERPRRRRATRRAADAASGRLAATVAAARTAIRLPPPPARPPAAAIRRHPVAAPLGFKGKRNEESREVSDQGGNGLVLDLGRLWVGLVARGGGEGRREEPLGFGYTQPHQIKLHIIYFYHRISTVVA